MKKFFALISVSMLLLGCGKEEPKVTVEKKENSKVTETVKDKEVKVADTVNNMAKVATTSPKGEVSVVKPYSLKKVEAKRLKWDLPIGWAEREAQGIINAEFSIPNSSDTRCYIIKLHGQGGGIEGNIQRWLGQMCHKPFGTKDEIKLFLKKQLKETTLSGEELLFVDLTPLALEKKAPAVMVGVITYPTFTLYVKMFGLSEKISPLKDDLLKLCRSIRFE